MLRDAVDLDRRTITGELWDFVDDFIVDPRESLPGYLRPIADDAGVDLSALRRLVSAYRRKHATGASLDRMAGQIGRIVDELREQVLNASIDQVLAYAAARSRWIES